MYRQPLTQTLTWISNLVVPAIMITACGTEHTLVELTHQLAWIGAALSCSPFGDKLAYCEVMVMNTASQHTQFDILFHFEPLHPTEDPAGCLSFVVHLLYAIS